MKHFGDITKIHGDQVPIVDIITGGSPCQDLSVAGKRAGLAGERSGLFMEQMRIVKEMRNESKRRLSVSGSDYDIRCVKPRYMVWENVAGAFSSGNPKGADFRAVLEEIVKVVVKEIPDIPIPEKGWPYSGCIEGMGDDGTPFSIAWRLHDAQYWGVPQRRKRIALVADFGGQSAPQILFECKGMSGNTEQSEQKRETTSGNVGESINQPSSYTVKVRGGVEVDSLGHKAGKGALVQTELSGTLGVSQDQTLFQNVSDNKCLNPWDVQSKHIQPENGIAESLYAGECRGGGGESYVMVETEVEVRKYPVDINGLIKCLQDHRKMPVSIIAEKLNKPKTLVEHWFRKDKCFAIPDADIWLELKALLDIDIDEFDASIMAFEKRAGKYDMSNRIHIGDVSPTFTASSEDTVYCLQGNGIDRADTAGCNGKGWREDKSYTLDTIDRHAVCQPTLDASGCSWDGTQTAPTLIANNANGAQRMPDKQNFNAVISYDRDRASFNPCCKKEPILLESNQNHATIQTNGISTCLPASMGEGGGYVPIVCGVDTFNQDITGNKSKSLNSAATDSDHVPCVMESKAIESHAQDARYKIGDINQTLGANMEHDAANGGLVYAVDQGAGKSGCNIDNDKTSTLTTTHGGEPAICYGIDRSSFNQGKNALYDFSIEEDKAQTLVARGPGGVMTASSEAYVQETQKE